MKTIKWILRCIVLAFLIFVFVCAGWDFITDIMSRDNPLLELVKSIMIGAGVLVFIFVFYILNCWLWHD